MPLQDRLKQHDQQNRFHVTHIYWYMYITSILRSFTRENIAKRKPDEDDDTRRGKEAATIRDDCATA